MFNQSPDTKIYFKERSDKKIIDDIFEIVEGENLGTSILSVFERKSNSEIRSGW